NAVQRLVEWRLLRQADAYVVHGELLAEQAVEQAWYRPGAPVFRIRQGMLAQPSGAAPLPDEPTILFFGRVEYYKGLDVLVDAVPLCESRLSGLKVIVAGTGADLERCRALAHGNPRFEWHDRFIADEDIPDLFARASVSVLPYREASQSAVAALAFSNRRAVVASRVGALPEAIRDGVTGALVPPEDPGVLADVLCEVLSNRAKLDAMSDAALEEITAGRLSRGAIAAAHIDAYRRTRERLTAGGGSPR
ncbi:MAG: glycosyltransferase family 4 protein, partial [Actinomycetota bacterium]|nr:glycosyltransferase family 4 protein [Actinomycetota bacterium]